MAAVTIPSIGVGMTDALLIRWLKEPGDAVEKDEGVAEIETDKVTMELVAPVAGTVGQHLFEAGAIIDVGVTVVEIQDGSRGSSGGPATAPLETPSTDAEMVTADVVTTAAPSVPCAGERLPHTLSPRARRLARERVTAGAAAASDAASVPTATAQNGDSGRFREIIAERVSESWRTIPHFAVTREIDGEAMFRVLNDWRASGIRATLTDLLLRALALAHRETGTAGDGTLGLAVATREGVVIPVVRDVLALDKQALTAARSAAVERARSGRLVASDLAGTPPSTLSNLGARGVDSFTGIVALGQQSLLTVGRALPRVVASDARTMAIRTTMIATVNADHRVLDGSDAAGLLEAFARAAEDETWLDA